MTKKTSWRSSILPISIALAVAGIILACADVEMENYPTSFFAPEITHNTKYAEFYRSFYPLYVSGYKEGYITDFQNTNLDEWNGYFKNAVQQKDLFYILYKARLGEVDTLIFSIKKPGFPISNKLQSNSVLKVADTHSSLDFLYYAGFAKRCEKYTTYTPGWYDDNKAANDPRKDKAGMAKLADGGIRQIANASSDFVKQRYAFQVLRLYYMSADYDKCIQFYNDQKAVLEATGNTIKYRAMGYLAGAYFKSKQYANANYLYSLVYDQCDSMKVSAYFSFHPQEQKDFEQTLALAKSPREKAVLWQMLGIYQDPFRALKEVYEIDPKSDLLDLLLARTVNVVEEEFLPGNPFERSSASPDSVAYIKSAAINPDIPTFLKMVADKKNTAKPYEWNLAAGYLSWAVGDNNYQKYLDKAKSQAKDDKLVQEQIRLIELVAAIKQGKAGDKKFEEAVVPELKWLTAERHDTNFRKQDAYIWVMGALTVKYAANGDYIRPSLFSHYLDGNKVQNDALLKGVEAFMDKKDKTPFDEFALSEFQYNRADIVEMQAVKLLYNYDFKGALAKMNEDPNAGKEACYGDPFKININDCHDCDAADKKKTAYTKLSFIQQVINLEAKAQGNPKDVAEVYFLLANAYYNMNYFGNNRVLYDTKATYMGDAGFDYREYSSTLKPGQVPNYMSCAKAESYYVKAMNASTDPEFKAKCCFMAAKCEQNAFFCNKPPGYKGDFKSGKYFLMLKMGFSSTQYYKEIINECGYFKTYLHG
ncbi:MAG TPA: hypothetical protein VK806_05800 [Bacteroidia bacterium]|jgi:hypothetical protein|nr:hypothetical protein [Bacteroidia bacterium]